MFQVGNEVVKLLIETVLMVHIQQNIVDYRSKEGALFGAVGSSLVNADRKDLKQLPIWLQPVRERVLLLRVSQSSKTASP